MAETPSLIGEGDLENLLKADQGGISACPDERLLALAERGKKQPPPTGKKQNQEKDGVPEGPFHDMSLPRLEWMAYSRFEAVLQGKKTLPFQAGMNSLILVFIIAMIKTNHPRPL